MLLRKRAGIVFVIRNQPCDWVWVASAHTEVWMAVPMENGGEVWMGEVVWVGVGLKAKYKRLLNDLQRQGRDIIWNGNLDNLSIRVSWLS